MKCLYLMVLGIMLQLTAFTQQLKLAQKQLNEKGKIVFAVPEASLASTPENELSLLQAISSSEKRLTFRLAKTITDDYYRHNYYTVSFMGLEIVGADYVVHAADEKVSFANGILPDVKDSSYQTKPQTSAEKAQASLRSQLSEENRKQSKGIEENKLAGKGLVWFYRQHNLRLAHKIEVKSTNPFQSGIYIIDATDGKRLEFYPDVCTGFNGKTNPPNATGVAQTLYSGVQNFVTDDNFNGGFRLRQVRNGVNILTLNANNQQNPETIVNTATDFFDNDNNWQAAEHGADRYATDVHWATQNVIDYWQQIHNRNSIDGNGMAARGYVHTFIPHPNPAFVNVNAYWHRDRNAMFYGDGNQASGFGPIAAFDVVAHEFGHGVCQYTSNLNAGTAESAALNEGFSDIWGATIEAWAAPGKQRWLIGEDIFPFCLRNLQNPNDPLASEGSHPDTYLGTFWRADGESHNNSTVLSHWFFLLSQGGNGTNDLGNAFNVTGIGITDAARIAYLTERLLNATANYAMARTMSIQAATQLFGVCSNEVVQVTNAWFAVGVGGSYTPPPIQLSVTQIDCDNATISANFPSGSTFNWQVNGNLLIDGTSTTKITTSNTINVTGNDGSVYVTTTGACGALQGGVLYAPFQRQITGLYPEYVCGDHVSVSVNTTPYDTYYRWYINNTLVSQSSYGSSFCTCYYEMWDARVPGDNTIRVEIETSCGSTSISNEEHFFRICGGYRVQSNVELFPNPARDQVTVKLKQINAKRTTGQLTDIREVRVLDKLGSVRRIVRYSANTNTVFINIANLPLDVYYVEITDGKYNARLPLSIIK